MLLVLRNETQANSLTRSLFLVDFEAVSASLLACDVIIAKKMGRQIKRPLRSNLKRKTTRWPGGGGGEVGAGGVLHIKGKGREKKRKKKKFITVSKTYTTTSWTLLFQIDPLGDDFF